MKDGALTKDWREQRQIEITQGLLRSAYNRVLPRPVKENHDDGKTLRMRIRLFRADPHCFWCGVETVLETSAQGQSDFATVDHLYSRWHPERKTRHVRGDGVLHVLACSSCNGERAGAENQSIPFVPKLPERREFAQLADATLARKSQPKPEYVVKPPAPTRHPDQLRTLKEEHLEETCRVLPMRRIETLEQAIQFARENPSR